MNLTFLLDLKEILASTMCLFNIYLDFGIIHKSTLSNQQKAQL